ncbi:ML1 [Symbiodinium natans]|uniref:ML1 protein n=1 Tax=Symbiodinium natans TaxID=878477 RepID=A0A812UB52_9DINO|nr:ML1 [Symbiodinium natans]
MERVGVTFTGPSFGASSKRVRLDSNVFPCQQIPQLPMQQSRIPNGAMDSVPPQLVQVSAQGFSGPMDERQLPKPKGRAKKQTAQTKQPMPMAFNSGGGEEAQSKCLRPLFQGCTARSDLGWHPCRNGCSSELVGRLVLVLRSLQSPDSSTAPSVCHNCFFYSHFDTTSIPSGASSCFFKASTV